MRKWARLGIRVEPTKLERLHRDILEAETEIKERQAHKDFLGHHIYRQEGCGAWLDTRHQHPQPDCSSEEKQEVMHSNTYRQ